jgi:hypothetical protein
VAMAKVLNIGQGGGTHVLILWDLRVCFWAECTHALILWDPTRMGVVLGASEAVCWHKSVRKKGRMQLDVDAAL